MENVKSLSVSFLQTVMAVGTNVLAAQVDCFIQ